ncbi:somatostatin receptor type 4-like [Hydractinia symbiolongicarpus]|uniref:somatostatin receptor type 4-like n=1 Tax=Hydractinia symbiolongicarpus TaxID=13093 RepID=UPI00254D625D|nr:somatostatin receptor type 4-like [Hydractinia symbiolongicarpus]
MLNTTHVDTDVELLTDVHRILLTVMYSIIVVFGVPANLMILIIIIWNKKLRQLPLNQYIVTLAFTDLLTCGLAAPFYIFSLNVVPNSNVLQNGVLCKGFLTVTYSTGMLTVSALAALSIDRYLAIVKPFLYCKHITRQRVLILNLSLFVQVLLVTLPSTIIKGYFVNSSIQGLACRTILGNMNLVYLYFLFVVNVVLPLLAITLCNIVVFKVARKQYKKTKADFELRARESWVSQSVVSHTATRVVTKFSTNVNRVRKVHPIQDQIESEKKSSKKKGTKGNNMPSFEVAYSVPEKCGTIHNAKTQNTCLKEKDKDFKRSLSRFRFQYRIYISTLSMIILLFIFWSPFPILRVIAMMGYKELVTNYGFLYSTLGTALLSAINPIVIFVTRREFQKYTCIQRKKKS